MKKYNDVMNWTCGLILTIFGGLCLIGIAIVAYQHGGFDISPVMEAKGENWFWGLWLTGMVISFFTGMLMLKHRHDNPYELKK